MTDFTPLEAPANEISALPLMNPGKQIGRDDALRRVYTHLQNNRPVLIHGVSGAGKTALAAALATAYIQQNYDGGVLWLNSRTHPLPALLAQVGRGLQVDDVASSDQPASHIGALSAAIMREKPVIVLDNVVDALAPQQFIDKAADTVPLILISEQELEGPWEKVALTALEDVDALKLFKVKSGIQGSDHDINIYGIIKLLGYNPLPIVIAARGTVAAKQTPEAYLKNLKTVHQSSGDGTTAAIALSYRTLSSPLQGLLFTIGATFKGQASLGLLAKIGGVPAASIQQAMKILAQLYMVEEFSVYGEPYYRLHPEVHDFTKSALKGQNKLDALQKKVHDSIIAYAQENTDNPQKLAQEMENFLVAAQWASENGNRETANELATALMEADDFTEDAGYAYELAALLNLGSGTQAFPAYEPEVAKVVEEPDDGFYSYDDDEDEDDDDFVIDSSAYDDFDDEDDNFADYDLDDYDYEDDDEPTTEDTILGDMDEGDFATPDLGDLDFTEGMDSSALHTDALQGIDIDQLRQALAQSKSQNDTPRTLQILKAIGKVQVGQSKETEAISTYNDILELYEAEQDQEGILDTLNMLGSLLIKTGNSQAAVMHATRGIQQAKDQNDSTIELQMHLILGDARQDLGETQVAVDSFKKALEISRNIGDRQHEAIALYKLGNAHLDNGSSDDAIHSLEQARELFKDQSKRDYEGRVLGALGSANSELEQWSEAIGYYTSALYIAREVDDKDEERLQLSSLAQAQEQAGKMGPALQSYRQALHLAFETENTAELVPAIVDLVRLLLISPVHLDIADMLLKEAMTIDPEDKDVLDLFEQVSLKRQQALASGKAQKPVNGDARDYAANAYALI